LVISKISWESAEPLYHCLANHWNPQNWGQLDGKFMAALAESLRFPSLGGHAKPAENASFWRDPDVQDEREQRDAGNTGEPEANEPQEALAERARGAVLRHQ
jgi:hypothetical protein